MRRRDFIAGGGGALAAWPSAARAQTSARTKRIGVLLPAAEGDPVWQSRLAAFLETLAQKGWIADRNARIETRWGTTNVAELRKHAAEIVALAPDVILAGGTSAVGPLLQATRTLPIVFTLANDPVGSGFVDSLARPGGNATGFMAFEFSIAGKWVELLKEIAPGVTRVGVLRDATQALSISIFATIQAVAPSLGMEAIPLNMREARQIAQSVEAFARAPHGSLIPAPNAAAVRHRDLIVALAARHKLPAIYWERLFVPTGGLISYGPDLVAGFRQAAGYVDRVLKGEKPADLPVQAPTKLEMTINLKTAKALGLQVPAAMLARADEVIE